MTFIDPEEKEIKFSSVPEGLISLKGCSFLSEEAPNPCEDLAISEVHVDNTEPGGGNGSIDVTVNGGSGTYTYLWSNGQTTEDLSSLSPGVYTLTVTDDNNCTASISVTIEDS
jgi:hypothetical protein